MKKNWQIKIFVLILAATMLACQAVIGPLDDEDILEPSSQESVPQDAPQPSTEVEAPVNRGGEDESCLGVNSIIQIMIFVIAMTVVRKMLFLQ